PTSSCLGYGRRSRYGTTRCSFPPGDDFSGTPVQDKGFHRVVGSADDRRGTVVARDIDARPVGAHDNVPRVGTGARGRDDVVQTADDLDRIIHHDIDVIGAYRDFARPAPKRNRRDLVGDGINRSQVGAYW